MISIKDVNQIWLILVLTHMAGSLTAAYVQLIPGGGLAVSFAAGLAAGWLVCGEKWYKAAASGILSACLFRLACRGLPTGYRASLCLLMIEMVLILWIQAKNNISIRSYCRIRGLSPVQIPAVVLAGGLMYIFCAYFNAWSMLIFRNYIGESLTAVNRNLVGSLLIFALFPAVVEEIFFRGIFFRGMGASRAAVAAAALLFALMHMNFNQMCYALAAGFALGTVVWITDNLTISMVMHFVFNGVSVLITNWGDTALVGKLLQIRIGSYAPLMPVLFEEGHPVISSIGTGLAAALLSLAAIIFLVRTGTAKETGDSPAFPEGAALCTEDSTASPVWTGPDWRMLLGCGLCIFFALAREL